MIYQKYVLSSDFYALISHQRVSIKVTDFMNSGIPTVEFLNLSSKTHSFDNIRWFDQIRLDRPKRTKATTRTSWVSSFFPKKQWAYHSIFCSELIEFIVFLIVLIKETHKTSLNIRITAWKFNSSRTFQFPRAIWIRQEKSQQKKNRWAVA